MPTSRRNLHCRHKSAGAWLGRIGRQVDGLFGCRLAFPTLLDRDSELTVATQGQVQVSSASDEDRSFATLSLAFSSDPVARWCFPDADRYLTYWPQLMRAFAGAAFVDGAADLIDDCSGVALWLPPGVAPDEEAIGRIFWTRAYRPPSTTNFSALWSRWANCTSPIRTGT